MKRLILCCAALVSLTALATPKVQAETCKTAVKKHAKKAETPCDQDLRELLQKQQAEIDELKAKLGSLMPAAPASTVSQADVDAAKQQADAASAAAAAASAKVDAMSSSVNDLKTTTAGLSETVVSSQKKIEDEIDSPTAIHYKGVLIQPGGYFAAESVVRSRTMNADIATPFSSEPYGNSNNYFISEFNATARQSRVAMQVTAPQAWGKAGGYVEADFLSAGTTSNSNQTNSYTMRIREAFGQVSLNKGFTFQGGQMWTLATEVKKGILAGPNAEALPPTIDPNYSVGFQFGRQYGLRFAQSLAGGKANVAFAVENSQIVFTGSNAPANFFFGGAGSSGGLFNSTGGSSGGGSAAGAAAAVQNYTDNLAPDLHLKATFDPGIGHYEVGGILRFFRERWYPQTVYTTTANTAATSTVGQNVTTPGGGVYASARVPVTKYFDVALKGAYGAGIARYGASNLGDVTVRENGKLEPLRTVDGLFELDVHPTPKLDLFAFDGAEYLQRTVYKVVDVPGNIVQVGYGGITTQNDTGCSTQTAPVSSSGYGYSATPSCSGATRYLLESSVGFTYRFFSSPTKGRFQFSAVYSYLDRQSWQGYRTGSYSAATGTFAAGTTFGAAQGINNMFFTGFRYYIP
jgi:FKBP-type peptidyl-prolyl cis-trans isomerase